MSRSRRDEFTPAQKKEYLEQNADIVVNRWRAEFSGKIPHYICENCKFVSNLRDHFEVDHIVACARGGTRNRESTLEDLAAGNIRALFRAGENRMLLCRGCNQAKKARQFIPPGAGYAYRRPEWDRNPDHIYYGRPKVTAIERERHPEPYNSKRYK